MTHNTIHGSYGHVNFDHMSFYHPQKLKLRGVFLVRKKTLLKLYHIPNFGGKGCQVSGGLS